MVELPGSDLGQVFLIFLKAALWCVKLRLGETKFVNENEYCREVLPAAEGTRVVQTCPVFGEPTYLLQVD